MKSDWPSPVDAKSLRARFDRTEAVTFGLEEEIMVLDPSTLDLLACGPVLLEGLDRRFKPELPAAHIEIASSPHTRIDDLAVEMRECRRMLAGHVGTRARLAVAGVHPFSARSGAVNSGDRYARMLAEYGDVLRQQLVCGLHVHVGLAGADRTLGVYNAMRSWLPELAALAANAPVHCGRDTSMASVRPLISGLLPRQGMPPPLSSWQEYADHLNSGMSVGRLGRPG
ncbi:MAG TPA: glutamate-cysteine ligase family protein, partial [Actinomycetota bacterium]|nr:glutamate-cysteine ligase family protein [Actinomycetota bacterium]